MIDFPYRPLDLQGHEIRILKLEWNRPRDRPLLGTLEYVSLVDPGSYIALSYCWGHVNDSQTMWISPSIGTPLLEIKITENLYAALCALWKRKGKGLTNLRVWIDAVCINQNDTYERSQQVQVMRQIYSKAMSVVAWVGPFGNQVLSPKTVQHLSSINAGVEHMKSLPFLGDEWDALKDFFDEMYWKVS